MKKVAALMMMALIGAASAQDDRVPQTAPATTAAAAVQAEQWSVWGGELRVRWNRNLLKNFDIEVSAPDQSLGEWRRMDRFSVGDAVGLQLDVKSGDFAGFAGGALRVRGGYDLRLPDGGDIALRDFSLQKNADSRFNLDVISADGARWFYADKLMFVLERNTQMFVLRSMDLRIAPELAKRLGRSELAGRAVAELRSDTPVWRGGFPTTKGGSCPTSTRWPGQSAPGGGTYQADVFMQNFTIESERENTTADGPGGLDTGRVKFTPSSTLRNNVNDGSAAVTISNDPRGTSSALHAADVVWRQKFFANCPPYNNDQHPYLIWNLYRIDPEGRIEQIGRSGVKHAFLTTNQNCSEEPVPSGYVLERGCSDTYGVSNNDSPNDLGPRNEVVAAPGLWGRCGSIHDPNCNGNDEDFVGYSDFTHRLVVQEGRFDPTRNAGASYFFESWYIVRDDINIYNTMQTRTSTFSWSGGWNINHPAANGDMLLGPAIDRWVSPGTANPNQRNTEIVNDGGHAKVAVKVTDLGGGQYRYDYAVMNFDFARAETQGSSPNLRVLSNDGFTAFTLPISQSLTVTGIEFSDGDNNAANDWSSEVEIDRIVWTAPAGNRLNWGTMFRFSLTANAVPVEADANLTTALTSSVETLQAASLVPQSEAVATYAVGGELTGLAAGESVSLRLNAGTPIQLDANDVFAFPDELIEGSPYTVAISAQPVTQNCTIAHETGTIDGADIVDVLVTCVDLPPPMYSVSGSVAGLDSGRSVTLRLNGGERLLRGGTGFLGYWNKPAATADKFTGDPDDAWCRTGDTAVMDADGYLWYQGRSDDVFKVAGYRIGPSEIENCLVKHPAVANAAVVPKPDAERGAVVKAYVVLAPGWQGDVALVATLQQHVRAQLAPYEYPKEIEFIDSLPMTTTGKVQRRVLRLQEEARAGRAG